MHKTINNRFIGHLDSHSSILSTNKIVGWVVNKTGFGITSKNITLVNTESRVPIAATVEINQRPDVHKSYFKREHTFAASSDESKYFYSGFTITYAPVTHKIDICVDNETVFTVDAVINVGSGPTKIDTNTIKEKSVTKITTPASTVEADLDNIIKINSNTRLELIVVDNFYENPDEVRKYALKQEFKADERYHKGLRTIKNYIPNWIGPEFSRLLHKKEVKFIGATGVFQYCIAKDNVVYHFDNQQYAAMVYLTPNAPLQTGTQTFRSIHTKLYHAATDADAKLYNTSKQELDKKSFNGNNFYDRHNMELVDSVANVYNRCVIFNARALHAATGYFGDTLENSRLFHLFFFNAVDFDRTTK